MGATKMRIGWPEGPCKQDKTMAPTRLTSSHVGYLKMQMIMIRVYITKEAC
jgi:hypothetical protein